MTNTRTINTDPRTARTGDVVRFTPVGSDYQRTVHVTVPFDGVGICGYRCRVEGDTVVRRGQERGYFVR